MAAVLYAVGLLIVNVDYARFGFADYGVFRSRYIAVGATFAALLVPPLVFGFAIDVMHLVERVPLEVRRNSVTRSLVQPLALTFSIMTLAVIASASAILGALGILVESARVGYADTAPLLQALAKWLFLVVGLGAWLRVLVRLRRRAVASPFLSLATMGVLYFCGVAVVGYYATALYPQLPHGVGGGRPEAVLMYPRADARADIEGLLAGPHGEWKLALFDETDAGYVIGLPAGGDGGVTAIVFVSRDAVAAIRHDLVRQPGP